MAGFSRYFLIVCLSTLLIACSGGGSNSINTTAVRDDGSTFDIDFLLNGPNRSNSNSSWVCESWARTGNSVNQFYAFSIWGDGTGTSSAVGDFNWVLNGADVEISPIAGPFSIVFDVAYDIARDSIGFLQFLSASDVRNNYCTR